MLFLFFAQGAKAYFAWVVSTRPLRNSFLISRHHANIRRWCYGVATWVDVSETPWRLTEALVAELSVCVALGWSLCVCVCVCVFSSHSFWTSSSLDVPPGGHTGGRSHRISHPPSFCGACLNFSREKDPAFAFPRRP